MLRRPSADITEPIEFLCLSCSQQFNTTDRTPVIVCPRSHSCCLHCFQTRLFNNAQEDAQVFCFHCHHPIKKTDSKKFDLFQEVLKTAVRLRAQDTGTSKGHSTEGEEDINAIRAELAQERSKNQWLVQQYTTLERVHKNALHKHVTAETEYERTAKKYQRNIDRLSRLTWESRGDKLFSDGKFKEVVELSQQILKAAPGIDFDIDGLGNVEDRAGANDTDVIAWYKQTSKQPSNPYDILCLGFSLLENYQQAESWYSHRLGKDKDNYRIMFGLANVLYNSGKLGQAQKLYLRVVELKPDFEKSYRQLAFIKTVKENKKQEGKKWASIAKQKNSQNVYADYLLAISEENADSQIEKLTRLSETLSKPYPRIYNALGFAFKQKKEYDEAITCFKKCIEINPSYEVPYFNLGIIHQERGQYDEAAKYYEESIKKNEKYVNAYLGLGNLFAKKKGEEEKAIEWYLKCLEVSPSSVPVHNGLGRVYAITEKYDDAIRCFQKCISLNQKHELSYNSLGNVYFYRGEFEEAIKWYQQCIEINPKYLGPYNGLCSVYAKKGDQDEAKRWVERRDAISAPSS